MTLVVLGLDALDAGLVERYDLEHLLLSSDGDLETYSGKLSVPYTLEVWPTIATGLHADEHGVSRSGTSEWSNPVLELGSRLTGSLSERTRTRLGTLAKKWLGAEDQLGRTSEPTVFDAEGRVIHNWPGVTTGTELQRVWSLMSEGSDGSISRAEFDRRVFGILAEQFGWAMEMPHHEVAVAAVHVHAADAFGHAYAEDEARLRETYLHIDDHVGRLVDSLGEEDELLILSDHGMTTPSLDPDRRPGEHSMRAYVSSTTDSVPESVFEVREWIEDHSPAISADNTPISIPKDQLRDLGYL